MDGGVFIQHGRNQASRRLLAARWNYREARLFFNEANREPKGSPVRRYALPRLVAARQYLRDAIRYAEGYLDGRACADKWEYERQKWADLEHELVDELENWKAAYERLKIELDGRPKGFGQAIAEHVENHNRMKK